MSWIYLSPHLDDVVFSCGGLVWEQVQAGETVEIWTILAGDPPRDADLTPLARMLHKRWGAGADASALRRREDIRACSILGATPRHFDYLDCIYRRLPGGVPVVETEANLFSPVHLEEKSLLEKITQQINREVISPTVLVSPLTLGGHMDHRLVRAAAEQLANQPNVTELLYYADYPYVAQQNPGTNPDSVEPMLGQISSQGIKAWQEAMSAYSSQISSFWASESEMLTALEQYWSSGGGHLWRLKA